MKRILYIPFLLFTFKAYAQTNLVKDSSFEDTIQCPNAWGNINPFLKYWRNPTTSSPDYYNTCAPWITGCNVPSAVGFQFPKTGNAYCGILVFDKLNSDDRDYIQSELSDTLKFGKKYCVSFYVSLANVSRYSISTIGAYFSNTAVSTNNYYNMPYTPQVLNPNTNQLNDTLNWLLIQGDFIANGGEKYITIGNFNNGANTDSMVFNPSPWGTTKTAYYYIDEVSVIECAPDGVNELEKYGSFVLYPNPNSGTMTLNYELQSSDKGEIVIYDLTGRKMSAYPLESSSTNLIISQNNLENGIYMYSIFVNNKVIQTDRLVIIK